MQNPDQLVKRLVFSRGSPVRPSIRVCQKLQGKTTPVETGPIEITQKADLTSRVLAMISGSAKVEDRSLADHALAEWLYKIYGSNDAKVREEFLKHYWKRDHADPETYIANTLKRGREYAAMHGLIRTEKQIIDPDTWPELFHTYEQIANVPAPKWIIEGFAEEFDKVMIGALSGHGKTLILLAIVRALLRSRDEKDAKLFGHFPVPHGEHKIMYLIPEEGLAKFSRRLRSFNLLPFVEEQRLLVRTLSLGPNIKLTDPRILRAAQGRHVVLDTAIRFSEGDENAASDNQNGLAQSVFNLESAGAASVWGAHHAPKSFSKDTYMELENVLRGSGDIGAMLSTAYGVRQLDDDRSQTLLHVRCIKPRDIDPPGDFQLEGKPWIDREHDFRMVSKPGETDIRDDSVATAHQRLWQIVRASGVQRRVYAQGEWDSSLSKIHNPLYCRIVLRGRT